MTKINHPHPSPRFIALTAKAEKPTPQTARNPTERDSIKSYSISFRIWHPTRSPEDISSKIRMTPSIAHHVGHPRTTPKGTMLEGCWPKTYCVYDIMRHVSGHFSDGLTQCVGYFELLAPVFDEMAAEGGVLEFYIWVYPNKDMNLGFSLDADLIKRIGNLNFLLSVEIYI